MKHLNNPCKRQQLNDFILKLKSLQIKECSKHRIKEDVYKLYIADTV